MLSPRSRIIGEGGTTATAALLFSGEIAFPVGKVLKGRRACRQFANVPSKSHVRCVPSQKGLLLERPQRHIANWAGGGISRPSGALRWTGPETRYGPFSLGVMVTSSIQSTSPFKLIDLDRSRHKQPTNADDRQCENR